MKLAKHSAQTMSLNLVYPASVLDDDEKLPRKQKIKAQLLMTSQIINLNFLLCA
jgi:hypothetical protein